MSITNNTNIEITPLKKRGKVGHFSNSLVFVAACAGLAFFGVSMLALGPILSGIGTHTNGLPSTLSLGIIIGTVIFGPVVDKFGYKWLLIIGSLLALAGIQGLVHFNNINTLHAAMLSLGIGGGILNGETNALVATIYDNSQRGSKLSILGAFYCVGALFWTLLNYFIPEYYTLPLNIVSLIMIAFVIFFFTINFPPAQAQTKVSLKTIFSFIKYPALLLFALLLFFQSGFEGITGNFTVQFLEKKYPTPHEAAVLSLTSFIIGMLAGRFLLGWFIKKVSNDTTLYIYLMIALAGVAILYFPLGVTLVYVAMALIGLGVGATYPVVFNYLGNTFKDMSGTAFSIAIFIALWGQFTFNKITGLLFNHNHFRYFPVMLTIAVVTMMLLLPLAKRNIKD
ncbi:MAG: MFS transporter [Paludibacteraceae bacterium]